jgi:hypothetical protein
MIKLLRHSLVLSSSLLALSGVAVLAAGTSSSSSAALAPPSYDSFEPPAKGSSYPDPIFGTMVKRLSDAMTMTDNAGRGGLTTISTEYSTASPFNADNSRLILQHNSYFGLYDGNGNYQRDLPFDVNVSTEPRWSRTDPDVLYFVSGNRLNKLAVGSGAISVLHTFTEYSSINGKGESDISQDGDHFVFAGDGRHVFVYEISSGRKSQAIDLAGHAFNNLYISPSNSVLVGFLSSGTSRYTGIEMYDRNMNFQRQVAHALGHMHLTRDTNGDEVVIWTNSGDPQPIANCQNGIVKVRLANAAQTCLLQLDWNLAVHITAGDGNGVAFVETYDPRNPFPQSSWAPYTNEILQVRLDGTETQRLVHHRSRPFDSYVYQPKATVSRDGSRLVFTSNQNLQSLRGYPNLYADTYLVNLSSSGAPTTPPTTTPGPAPTPTPTPTTPASTANFVEQDNPAVSYTGGWSQNLIAGHSGGSAYLAMDPGSRATFTFSGKGASWIGYRDEWSGIATIRVDGVIKGTVDSFSSPGQAKSTLYTIAGLSNGTHTLSIEVSGTKNAASGGSWIWIDAFAATR